MKIKEIKSFEILDSRGSPTVATLIKSDEELAEFGFVPSGASTGSREAIEKRDNGNNFDGKGVSQVIKNAEEKLFPELIGMEISSLEEFDARLIELDGTKNKKNFGANIILSLSLAFCKLSASKEKKQLYQYIYDYFLEHFSSKIEMKMPLPMMNILNGGEHADNNVDIQEFMIQPVSATSFAEALRVGAEIFHNLKKVLGARGMATSVGDEGGFAPDLPSNAAALEVIAEAVANAGYVLGEDITLALDCAASEFYRDGEYHLSGEGRSFSSEGFSDYLANLAAAHPIVSIEDGLDESDWAGWAYLTQQLGDKVQLVGDDLFVTNTSILKRGIDENIGNSILIKFNQIGSLSETLDAIKMAQDAGFTAVISHRSGETEDATIADLAVGTGAGQIKTGSLCRSDRVAKYNRLLRIEAELGMTAPYRGRAELERGA